MIENLLPLKIPPGLFANGTKYQAAGRWNDGNLVRFHEGTIQPIGGWAPVAPSGAAMLGTANAAISWLLADGTPFLAVGTSQGLYVIDDNDVVYDVTPTSGTIHAAPYDWQLATFGAYLVAVNTLLGDDDISLVNTYIWTGATGTPAAAAWTSAIGPRGAYSAFATPERFITVLRGEDPTTAPARTGVDTLYSERRVYWASQEQLDGFVSTDINTGGNFDLSTDGRLIVGTASRGQSLLWTDVDLWTMNYIGGDLIYSFANAGRQCGIVSKRAFVVLDKGAFWMGRGKFFVYDGYVRNVPCEVTDAVFGNFNEQFAHTVWTIPNPRFNEVTWFYPSLGATTPDRYVTYNYEENHWTFGQLQRAAGLPQRFRHDVINAPVPLMWDGVTMFNHETGSERGAQAFVTSGPIELGAGDRLIRIQGIVPDDRTLGDVQLRLYAAMAPDGLEAALGPFSLETTTPLRTTARQVRVRLEETGATDWRIGQVRLAVRPAERRGPSHPILDTVPASLEILPPAISLIAAQHYTFAAIVRNAAGEALDIQPNVWLSDNPGVTINSDGTVTVVEAPCVANITAQLTTVTPTLISNTAVVTVAPRVPASITLAPTPITAELGLTYQVTATVRDVFGVVLTDQVLTWHTSDATKATVDATGLVTGVAATGTCNITATIASPAITSNNCVINCTQHWVVHQFTVNDTFVVTTGGAMETLLIGGGGSGGSVDGTGVGGGGGGAGGHVYYATRSVAAGSYPVGIGGGGIQQFADHTIGIGAVPGANGSDSTFMGDTAHGGGGGGGADVTLLRQGRPGGCGGGGASAGDVPASSYTGGASTAVFPEIGSAGGTGTNSGSSVGAGGGGANGSGILGVGGAGFTTDIWTVPGGSTITIAVGGGAVVGPASAAGAHSGNGGDGGGETTFAAGAAGADGVAFVRYPLGSGIVATGGTRVVLP